MKKWCLSLAILMLIPAVGVFAGDIFGTSFYTNDTSPAIRVKNVDPDRNPVSIVITSGDSATNTVTVNGTVNTLDWSGAGADTVAEIAASLLTCTNSSGKKILAVDYNCSLASESTDDELLDAPVAVVVQAGAWADACVWDTSDALFYSAYSVGRSKAGGSTSARTVERVYGNIGGTGNVTVDLYVDGVKKFEHVIVSPAYVFGVASSNNVADEVGPGQIDIPLDFYVGPNEDVMVRASRATTATTGSIGIKLRVDN